MSGKCNYAGCYVEPIGEGIDICRDHFEQEVVRSQWMLEQRERSTVMKKEDDKKRTRFSAVVEEMTAPIKPVTKPPVGTQAKPTVPQLFETIITVNSNGELQPCPKCSTSAFTPTWVGDTYGNTFSWEPKPGLMPKLICRGCPLPSPIYAVSDMAAAAIKAEQYRCCTCGWRSKVTLSNRFEQTNLYCSGCARLTLHDLQRPQEPTRRVPAPWVDLDTFKDAAVTVDFMQGAAESDVELKDRMNEYLNTYKAMSPALLTEASFEMAKVEMIKPLAPGNIEELIDAQVRKVASVYGMPEELLRRDRPVRLRFGLDDVARVADTMRERLGLTPFDKYGEGQRLANAVMHQMRDDDIDRRTGRTTRGLLEALAEVVLNRAGILFVKGTSSAHDKTLIGAAWGLYSALGLKAMDPLHTVRSTPPSRDYDPQGVDDVVLYTDHHYDEVKSRMAFRTGRYR